MRRSAWSQIGWCRGSWLNAVPSRAAAAPRRGSGAGRRARGRAACRAASGSSGRDAPPPRRARPEMALSPPQAAVLDLAEINLELVPAGGTGDRADRLIVGVEALVELLEVVEVAREELFDHLR